MPEIIQLLSFRQRHDSQVHLNREAYIGTNIKEGTTDVSMQMQHMEGIGKFLVVMWEDGEHHEVRFPIYLLEESDGRDSQN